MADDSAPRDPRGDDERRFDRATFVKAAVAGGAGVALLGGGAYWLLDGEEAFTSSSAPAPPLAPRGDVRRFFSRPDLRPPSVTVVRRADRTADGLLFLAPSSGPGRRGALIVDDTGDVVWFRPSTPDTTMDFRAGRLDGKPVLTWWEGRHEQGVGLRGSYVVADQSYREIARFRSRDDVKPDFHEVLLTPEGTALVLSYDAVPANLTSVGGSARGRVYDGVIQELDVPSGRVLWEWRSLDHVAVGESYQTEIGNPYDYFHVNSVGFDTDGHLLVSARNTWAIYKVHRRTGAVIWRLGGKKSDFAMGKGTRFAYQHDARSHENGRLLSLYDNGPLPKTKPRSRAIMLALDTERMRATLARQYLHSPPLFSRVTGNAQLLPNGNMFVCWGNTGSFSEHAPNGQARFDAKLPKGGQNYRVYRLPWTGTPAEAPKLVRHVARGRRPGLYVSWNGATEVASWQLRAGSKRSDLEPQRTVPKAGFETSFALPEDATYAAVVALDRRGRPLRSSNVVRV